MKRWEFFLIGLILLLVFYFKKEIYQVGVETYEYMKNLYDDLFKKWGEFRGLDWKLLRAFAKVESDFNPMAISPVGARGLMQIMPFIGKAYGGITNVEELFDPDKSIEIGSAFIKELMEKYDGDLDSVIQAYNLGETKFNKGYVAPDYLAKVTREYETLKGVEV